MKSQTDTIHGYLERVRGKLIELKISTDLTNVLTKVYELADGTTQIASSGGWQTVTLPDGRTVRYHLVVTTMPAG